MRADGTNVTAQHEWLNLAIGSGVTTDEFYAHGIPSLLPMPETGVFTRGTRDKTGKQLTGGGLTEGWETVLEKFSSQQVLPRMANKTAVGVFLGDEICCSGVT